MKVKIPEQDARKAEKILESMHRVEVRRKGRISGSWLYWVFLFLVIAAIAFVVWFKFPVFKALWEHSMNPDKFIE